MKHNCKVLLAVLAASAGAFGALAQGTAFTYQGRLNDGGVPANGSYDMQFTLYNDAVTPGNIVLGAPVPHMLVAVNSGLFTTNLDFGSTVFTGPPRWLEIGVRTNGSAAAYTVLSPRQQLTPTPYALYAENSGAVANSSISAAQLNTTGTPANGQVLGFNGGGLAWLNPAASSSAWSLTGNPGTTPGVNFLGTPDNQDVVLKSANLETLRVTTGQDLILQRPVAAPIFTRRNGLGVYGGKVLRPSGDLEAGARLFASQNVFGPVLYGEGGGGLGVRYQTNSGPFQDTLPLQWNSSGVQVNGGLTIIGSIIGNAAFSGAATFGASTRQMLDLYDNGTYVYGIGVQNGTLYQRTGSDTGGFAWYQGGVHNDAQNNPGGGNTLMSLDSFGNLTASGSVTGNGGTASSSFVFNNGVYGSAGGPNASGVNGYSPDGTGVNGNSQTGVGVFGSSVSGEAGHFNGKVFISGNASVCTLTIRGGCDLAEPFPTKEQQIEKGTVLIIDQDQPGQLKISAQAYDTRVAGVVSGANGINTGIALHQEGALEGGQNVALSGRVYVLAEAASSPIRPGDLLTTSATPGHAMRVGDHGKAQGAILGKAMSSLKEGRGLVLVLVTLQ